MGDPVEREPTAAAEDDRRAEKDREASRITAAAARAADHAARGLHLLERAARARVRARARDEAADRAADAASRDFRALRKEHDLDR